MLDLVSKLDKYSTEAGGKVKKENGITTQNEGHF